MSLNSENGSNEEYTNTNEKDRNFSKLILANETKVWQKEVFTFTNHSLSTRESFQQTLKKITEGFSLEKNSDYRGNSNQFPYSSHCLNIYLEKEHLFSFRSFHPDVQLLFSKRCLKELQHENIFLFKEKKKTSLSSERATVTKMEFIRSSYNYSFVWHTDHKVTNINTFYPSPKNSGSVGIP